MIWLILGLWVGVPAIFFGWIYCANREARGKMHRQVKGGLWRHYARSRLPRELWGGNGKDNVTWKR